MEWLGSCSREGHTARSCPRTDLESSSMSKCYVWKENRIKIRERRESGGGSQGGGGGRVNEVEGINWACDDMLQTGET